MLHTLLVKECRRLDFVGLDATDVVGLLALERLHESHHRVLENGSGGQGAFRCFGNILGSIRPHVREKGVSGRVEHSLHVLEECVLVLV